MYGVCSTACGYVASYTTAHRPPTTCTSGNTNDPKRTAAWCWDDARVCDVLLDEINIHAVCNFPAKARVQVLVLQRVHRIHHHRLDLRTGDERGKREGEARRG